MQWQVVESSTTDSVMCKTLTSKSMSNNYWDETDRHNKKSSIESDNAFWERQIGGMKNYNVRDTTEAIAQLEKLAKLDETRQDRSSRSECSLPT